MSKETTVNIAVLGIPSYLLLKEQYAEDGGAAKPLSGGGPGSATPAPVDTSEWNKLGVGKSSLCARFMLPRLDDYQRLSAQLCSSVTRGQFESQAISCDHFIYYGSTTRRYNINSKPHSHSDGEQTFQHAVRFHVVEQTTFIDPSTAAGCNAPLPFPGCSRYIESALKQVLTTNGQGGKLSCVSRPNQQQLRQNHDQHCSRTVANGRPAMSPRPGLDVQYPQGGEAFPESFHVDGFVLVLDMSRSEKEMELQQDLLASVVSQLRKQSQPKPTVLVVTKSETLSEDRQKAVKAYWKAISPGRQNTPLFFCSAEQGVVDAPFLHLSTLVIWESMAVKASRRRHPPLTLYRQHERQWTEQLRVAVLEVTPLVQRHAAVAVVDWSTVPLPELELQEGGRALSTVLGMVGESNCRSVLQTIADQLRKARQVGRETRVIAGPSILRRPRVIRKDQTVAKKRRSKSLTGHNSLPSHLKSATIGASVSVEELATCSDADTGRARWATLTPDGARGRHHQKPRISRCRFLPRDQPGCDPGEIVGSMSGEERDNEATDDDDEATDDDNVATDDDNEATDNDNEATDDDSDKKMAPARHRDTVKVDVVETQQLPEQEHIYISIVNPEGNGDSQQQGVAMGKSDSSNLSVSEQSSSDVASTSDSSSADDGYEKLKQPCPTDAEAHGVKRALRHVMSLIEETSSDNTDSDDDDGDVSRWRGDSSDEMAWPDCRESSEVDSLEDEEDAPRNNEADYIYDWEIHSYLPPALPKRRTGSGRSMAPAVLPEWIPPREQSKLVTGSSGRRKERGRDRAKKLARRKIPLRPHTTLPPRMQVPDLGASAPASAGVRGERTAGVGPASSRERNNTGAGSRGLEELRLSVEQQRLASVDSGITSLLGEDDDECRSTALSVSTSSASNCSDHRCIAQLSRSATDDHAASNPDDLDHDYILLDSVILPPVRTEQDQGESTVSGAPSASFSSRRASCSSHCDNGSAAETVLLDEQRAGDVVTTTPVEDTTIRHPLASLQSASASSNQNLCNGGNETSPAVWYVPLECASTSPLSLPPSPDPVMVKPRRVCSKPSEGSDGNAPSPTALLGHARPYRTPLRVAPGPPIKPKVKPFCSKPSEESDDNAPSPTVLLGHARPHSTPVLSQDETSWPKRVQPARPPRCRPPCLNSAGRASSPRSCKTLPHGIPSSPLPSSPVIRRHTAGKSEVVSPSCEQLTGNEFVPPAVVADDSPDITVPLHYPLLNSATMPAHGQGTQSPASTRPRKWPSFDMSELPSSLPSSPVMRRRQAEKSDIVSQSHEDLTGNAPVHPALRDVASACSTRSLHCPLLKSAAVPDAFGDAMSASGRPLMTSANSCQVMTSANSSPLMARQQEMESPATNEPKKQPSYDTSEPVKQHGRRSKPLFGSSPPHVDQCAGNDAPDVRPLSGPQHSEDDRSAYCAVPTGPSSPAPDTSDPRQINRLRHVMSLIEETSSDNTDSDDDGGDVSRWRGVSSDEMAWPDCRESSEVDSLEDDSLEDDILEDEEDARCSDEADYIKAPLHPALRDVASRSHEDLTRKAPVHPALRDVVSRSHEDLTGKAPVHPALRDVASACSTRSLRYPLLKSAAVPDAFGDAMSASGSPLMTSANSCQVMASANSSPLVARQQEMESPATNEPKKQPSNDTSEPVKQHGRRFKPLFGSSPPHVDQCAGNDPRTSGL